MKRIMSLVLIVLSFSLSCLSQDKLSYDSIFVSENTPSSAIYNKMCRFCTLYIKDINKKKCFDDVNKSIKCTSSIPINIDKMGFENTSGLIYFDLNFSIKDNECHVLINNFRHISNKYPDDFSIGTIYKTLSSKLTDLNGRSLSKARCNLVEVINPIAKDTCNLQMNFIFNLIHSSFIKNEPVLNTPLSYTEILHFNNLSSADLFDRAKSWALYNYNNVHSKIQQIDKDEKVIRITSSLGFFHEDIFNANASGKINYNLCLRCKDNKVKITYDNFYQESDADFKISKILFTTGRIYNDYPEKLSSIYGFVDFITANKIKGINKDAILQSDSFIGKSADNFSNYIKGYQPVNENNW